MVEKFYSEQLADIYCGHAMEVLKTLPDESVQLCMTSPPYWGLRNYSGGSDIIWGGDEKCEHIWGELLPEHHPGQVEQTKWKNAEGAGHGGTAPSGQWCLRCLSWRGQLGLEPTPQLYCDHLMLIFREVKRVLKKSGSFWLNLGDTFASGKGSCYNPGGGKNSLRGHAKLKEEGAYPLNRGNKSTLELSGLQPKCMVCIPERVMFAMINEGWILRNKLIWRKPNSMPSSVKDRFSTTYEMLYFFVKQRKYYFDLDSVRIPHKTQSLERYQRQVNFGDRTPQSKYADTNPYPEGTQLIYREGRNLSPAWFKEMFPEDKDYKGKFDDMFGHGPNPQSFNLRVRDVKRGKKGTTAVTGELRASEQEIEEYEYPEIGKHHGSSMSNEDSLHRDRVDKARHDFGPKAHGGMKTNITTPEEGPEPNAFHPKGKNPGDFLKITTQPSSISVCPECETVFKRMIKQCPNCGHKGVTGHFAPYPEALCETPIRASSRPGDAVLDPFAGGGTTGVAAKRLGRKSILIDCVKEYCIMAKHRISKVEYQPEMEIK